MSNIPIRDIALTGTPTASSKLVFDDGQMKAGTFSDSADAIRPVASQGEAEAGADNVKTMTALRTKQSIAEEVGTTVQAYSAALGSVSGVNTGDQTITLTGDVTGTGTGSFAATIGATKVTSAMLNADVYSTAHSWSGVQTFTAPVLGTPASVTLTNATGLPISSGVSGLGSNIDTFLVTPSSANLRNPQTDETGTGAAVFATAPTLSNPIVGTQSPGDNSTKAASTAYVEAAVSGGVAGVSSIAGNTGAFTLARGVTNSTNEIRIDPTFMRGYISGLGLSNNVTDATNDIDIAVGVACSDDQSALIKLTSALTKRLDAAWAVGTGNGGRMSAAAIADGTYHIWVIQRSDTGVTDVGFDVSATSPTMPTNYDSKRRIGSIVRASSAIKSFIQFGNNEFLWSVPVNNVTTNNPGTSAILSTLTVPLGIVVRARVWGYLQSAEAVRRSMLITSPSQADTAPAAGTMASLVAGSGASVAAGTVAAEYQVWTNTSGQIRYRLDGSSANTGVFITTNGWFDPL